MTKFFNKSKKNLFLACFQPISPHFWDKTFFLRNLTLSCTTTHWPSTPSWVSEKINGSIPRKLLDRRTKRQKVRQTEPNSLDLSGHCQGSNKYNCCGHHLKVKGTEKNAGLKLLHYCQHAKNLLNSWTHSYNKADFTILWTKRSCPFWPRPPKNHWSNF